MITALAILCGVGLVMASLLAVGRKVFAVDVDERQEQILNVLPGTNCGGCGFPGCSGYATALVKGEAEPNACPPGGAAVAMELGKILGVEVMLAVPTVALIACAGDNVSSPARSTYIGLADCKAAHAVAGGSKSCRYGCLGLGSCIDVCAYDAIQITSTGLVVVDKEKCTGCKKCIDECPRGIIKMVPKAQDVHVLCINPEKAKFVKAVCSVGCTGCKLCTKQSDQFEMNGPLAKVTPKSDHEIPESAALVCGQGSIFDGRQYDIREWLNDPSKRKDFEQRAGGWKKAEKERKAAAKAEKKAAPGDLSEDHSNKGGEK